MQRCYVNARINSGDDVATLSTNYVNFGPVTKEIKKTEIEIFATTGQRTGQK